MFRGRALPGESTTSMCLECLSPGGQKSRHILGDSGKSPNMCLDFCCSEVMAYFVRHFCQIPRLSDFLRIKFLG